MGRRKCVLRACPHYHYVLDSIGGTRIKLFTFPRGDVKAWRIWREFVVEHNGSLDEPKSEQLLCSAHFLPIHFEDWQTLKPGAVPSVAPEVVREVAIKNGDVSHPNPYTLPPPPEKKYLKNNTDKSPRIVLMEQGKRLVLEKHSSHSSMESSGPQAAKRKCVQDLSPCNFVCAEESKVAIRVLNDTLLKIWSGTAVRNKSKSKCSEVVRGREVEVIENCTGHCYGINSKVSKSIENSLD